MLRSSYFFKSCKRGRGYEIEEGSRTSKGQFIKSELNLEQNEEIVALIPADTYENKYLFFVTKHGIVKRTAMEEFIRINANGKKAISFKENDGLLDVKVTDGNALILIANNNCDFESEEYVDYSETIQYVCGDAGVETTSKINDEYSYSIQQAAYITSLKQIMSPSPAYRESTILYNFNEIASLGFGISNDNGIYAIKHELVKATNNNGTIEIEISSTLESEWMQDSVRTYKFTIVDNFMTHYEYVELFVADVDENTSYTNEYTDSFVYDVVKGELDEYTGELFPFEMPETSY